MSAGPTEAPVPAVDPTAAAYRLIDVLHALKWAFVILLGTVSGIGALVYVRNTSTFALATFAVAGVLSVAAWIGFGVVEHVLDLLARIVKNTGATATADAALVREGNV